LTFWAKIITLNTEIHCYFPGGEMAAQFQLVMHSGPTPGKTFPLEGDVLTIGREAGNQIVINDAEVSRKHSQLVFQGGKFVLTDLGSTNGTFVNGQRLAGQHVLQPGEIISLGEQINLLYEAIQVVDPNATMLSTGKPLAAAYAAPSQPKPQPQPPVYAGQIPAGPEPVAYQQAQQPAAPKSNRTLLYVGIGCLAVICLCVFSLVLVDYLKLWCVVSLNMIPGCQ
jgi:pSer/pThr/pTyr-binding forkhead associated (FHA) protein